MTDWNAAGPGENGAMSEDDPLSGLDWSGGPSGSAGAAGAGVGVDDEAPARSYRAAEPAAYEPDLREPSPRRGGTRRSGGSGGGGRGVSTGAFWGFLALALALGLGVGAGAVFWQRSTLTAEIRDLESRLSASEASATASAEQLQSLQATLASTEASIADLTARNTQLTSDLEAAKAALAAATASGTVTITERTVSPTSVEASHSLLLTVKVDGKADKVQMKIVSQSGSTYSTVYNLTKSTTSGTIVTWKRSVKAPGVKGMYRYYATAYVGTKKYEMPGTSAWTFEVK